MLLMLLPSFAIKSFVQHKPKIQQIPFDFQNGVVKSALQ